MCAFFLSLFFRDVSGDEETPGCVGSSFVCVQGEVEIALDRFDVILDVGKGVDLVANALLLDQKFDFERVSSIAEQGCSV